MGGASLTHCSPLSGPQDTQDFSEVERAIETLIRSFHQYSVEGGKETLTPSELQALVTQQLPHLMPVLGGPALPRPAPGSKVLTFQARAARPHPQLGWPLHEGALALPLANGR